MATNPLSCKCVLEKVDFRISSNITNATEMVNSTCKFKGRRCGSD